MSDDCMKSNVSALAISSRVHPDGILEAARNAKLKRVVIMGYDENGHFYCKGSESFAQTIFLLRNAEHELFAAMDHDEG